MVLSIALKSYKVDKPFFDDKQRSQLVCNPIWLHMEYTLAYITLPVSHACPVVTNLQFLVHLSLLVSEEIKRHCSTSLYRLRQIFHFFNSFFLYAFRCACRSGSRAEGRLCIIHVPKGCDSRAGTDTVSMFMSTERKKILSFHRNSMSYLELKLHQMVSLEDALKLCTIGMK